MMTNDPNDLASDGGITVLDVWRKEAASVLSEIDKQPRRVVMTEEEEDAYVFAQDLTRLRIAIDVLGEVIHDDFDVKPILRGLKRQVEAALRR